MSNFRDISRQLVKHGAAARIEDGGSLYSVVRALVEDTEARLRMGSRASELILASSGATERAYAAIRNLLSR